MVTASQELFPSAPTLSFPSTSPGISAPHAQEAATTGSVDGGTASGFSFLSPSLASHAVRGESHPGSSSGGARLPLRSLPHHHGGIAVPSEAAAGPAQCSTVPRQQHPHQADHSHGIAVPPAVSDSNSLPHTPSSRTHSTHSHGISVTAEPQPPRSTTRQAAAGAAADTSTGTDVLAAPGAAPGARAGALAAAVPGRALQATGDGSSELTESRRERGAVSGSADEWQRRSGGGGQAAVAAAAAAALRGSLALQGSQQSESDAGLSPSASASASANAPAFNPWRPRSLSFGRSISSGSLVLKCDLPVGGAGGTGGAVGETGGADSPRREDEGVSGEEAGEGVLVERELSFSRGAGQAQLEGKSKQACEQAGKEPAGNQTPERSPKHAGNSSGMSGSDGCSIVEQEQQGMQVSPSMWGQSAFSIFSGFLPGSSSPSNPRKSTASPTVGQSKAPLPAAAAAASASAAAASASAAAASASAAAAAAGAPESGPARQTGGSRAWGSECAGSDADVDGASASDELMSQVMSSAQSVTVRDGTVLGEDDRMATLCVLTVLLGIRNDLIGRAEEMDDVVEVSEGERGQAEEYSRFTGL